MVGNKVLLPGKHPAELMFLGILKTIENNRFRSFGWNEIT